MAEREDLSEFISNIGVPTMILVGREDAITPVADSEKMESKIAPSRLVVIENAGHVSNLEQTEQFNFALLRFLDRVFA
jgi:pimeloyl-ACP methyl ester carboxylesterase